MKTILASLCLSTLICACLLLSSCKKEESKSPSPSGVTEKKAIPVQVQHPVEQEFILAVRSHGTLYSKNFVIVSSRNVGGTLATLNVDRGDKVEGGKTLMFTLDKERLNRAVALSEAALATTKANVKVAEAQVASAKALLDKATLDKDRYVRLSNDGVATQNELENYTSSYDHAAAGYSLACAQVEAAKAQVANSEAALAIARKDLADAEITAPISGYVTDRYKEPGEEIKNNERVFRVEDTSRLEAVVSFPAQYYEYIHPGKTLMRLAIGGKPAGEFTVTYKSPTIETTLRTFQVKALFENPNPDLYVAGGMFIAELILDKRVGLGISGHAILERDGGPQVLVNDGNIAKTVFITKGYENNGIVEISGEGVDASLNVIVEGQSMLSNGDKVREVK